jgi:hypothetical protein
MNATQTRRREQRPRPPVREDRDWITPATRRVLAGEPTDRRGIVLAAQELAYAASNLDGEVPADFVSVMLMRSANASGMRCDSLGGHDELTRICRTVAGLISPRGKVCPKCKAPDIGLSTIHGIKLDEVHPKLARLFSVDQHGRGAQQGQQGGSLEESVSLAWGDDG